MGSALKRNRGKLLRLDRLGPGCSSVFLNPSTIGMTSRALDEGVARLVLCHVKAVRRAVPSRKFMPTRTRLFLDFLVQTLGGTDADPWLRVDQPRGAKRSLGAGA